MSTQNAAVVQTSNYLDAVKRNLDVQIVHGKPLCFLKNVRKSKMKSLCTDLNDIMNASGEASRADISSHKGAHLQLACFGKVDDFELAIKTGYLLGDRIVLWDYLSRSAYRWSKSSWKTRVEDVAVVATNLVSLATLAERGHLVILAHPLTWSPDAASAIAEVGERTTLTPEVAGLTATLAVAQQLKVHPYSIAENSRSYQRLLAIRSTRMRKYDYDTLLAALLSARLLSDARFDYVIDAPFEKIPRVIQAEMDFYRQFRERLTGGGLDEGDFRLEVLANEIDKTVKARNSRVRESAYDWATFGGTFAGIIGLVGAVASQNPALAVSGGLIGLSATLTRMFTRPKADCGVIGSVFRKLRHSAKERLDAFESALGRAVNCSDWAEDYLRQVPRGIGINVAMSVKADTAGELLSGPSDYGERYMEELFHLSPRALWRQVQIAIEEDAGVEAGWARCIPDFARRSTMPFQVLDAMLRYLVRIHYESETGATKKEILDATCLPMAISELEQSRKYRALLRKRIRQWVRSAKGKDRMYAEESLAWVFGGSLPKWLSQGERRISRR
jgi:hypothetical protein